MPTTAIADKRLSHAEFRVLVALISFANKEHKAWPSLRLISERSGIGKANVSRNLTRLLDLGFVQKSGEIYTLNFSEPKAADCDSGPVSAVAATTSTVVAATTSDVVTAPPSKHTINKPTTDQAPPNPPKPKTQLVLVSENVGEQQDPAKAVVSAWNAMASANGLPKCLKLSDKRKAAIRSRIQDAGSVEGVLRVINKIPENQWLLGDNPRSWLADFDYLLTQSKFLKLMERAHANPRKFNPRHGQHGQTLGDIENQYRSFVGSGGPA